ATHFCVLTSPQRRGRHLTLPPAHLPPQVNLPTLDFFLNPTAPTEIYTLSLHDALPIFRRVELGRRLRQRMRDGLVLPDRALEHRSEEHTSELQSLTNLVCRLLLEKQTHTGTISPPVWAHGRLTTRWL